MGQIMDGVARINSMIDSRNQMQEQANYRASQEARLDEQTRAAKAKQDEIDRINKLNKDADAAGAKVFDGFRSQHILDGGDQNDYTPAPDHAAAAYRARASEYLKAGDMSGFMKAHAEGAAERLRMRKDLVDQAYANDDPIGMMKALNSTVDNGVSLKGAEPITLPSNDPGGGLQAYRFTFVGLDGKPRDEILSKPQILDRARNSILGGAKVAAQEAAYALEEFKANQKIREQSSKGEQDRQTEGVQIKGRKEVAQVETQGRLQVEGAKGSQDRKTAGYKDGLERAKPVMFKPGDELKAPIPNKDGAIEYKTVGRSSAAKGGKAGLSSKDLNTMVINNFGVLDPSTGRQVGAESTANISAAAEQLMQANPDMGANEAIITAAQDLGLNIKAKK